MRGKNQIPVFHLKYQKLLRVNGHLSFFLSNFVQNDIIYPVNFKVIYLFLDSSARISQ